MLENIAFLPTKRNFMNLWTVKMSTTSWWTAVNGHTYTFVLYQSGIWLAPSAGIVCLGLQCWEHSLFFIPVGLLGLLYQAATRLSLPICYWGYSRFNLSLGLSSSSLCIALSRSPKRTYLTWISLYVVTSTLPQLAIVELSGGDPLTCYERYIPCPRSLLSGVSCQSLNDKSN